MSKSLTCLLAGLAFLIAVSPASADLVAYYDFEDSQNAPSLSGPDLTETGSGHTLGVAGGIVGNAVEFTGADGNVLTTNLGFGGGGTNQLGDNFTVSAWYNLDTVPSSPTGRFFVYEGSTDYDISYGLRSYSDVDGFADTQTFTNGLGSILYADAHTAGQWQHVAHTYESVGGVTTIRTYIDGTEVDSPLEGSTTSLVSEAINIGNARNTALTRGFDGKLDEIAFWDAALPAESIISIYNTGLSGLAIPEPRDPSTYIVQDFYDISDNLSQGVTLGTNGDLNVDGVVNFADFRQWRDNAPASVLAAAGFAVPEPSTVVLLGGVLAVLGLRNIRCR
ncbi:LamG-like jellyroll fold domain-containing protein [Aeoliella sp.]|uniref:LamG-like jellyroll fold domain-containing protein n=1 Tax=Aeoliella sp. TaxID=2795800 RepID=UPI003CCC0465